MLCCRERCDLVKEAQAATEKEESKENRAAALNEKPSSVLKVDDDGKPCLRDTAYNPAFKRKSSGSSPANSKKLKETAAAVQPATDHNPTSNKEVSPVKKTSKAGSQKKKAAVESDDDSPVKKTPKTAGKKKAVIESSDDEDEEINTLYRVIGKTEKVQTDSKKNVVCESDKSHNASKEPGKEGKSPSKSPIAKEKIKDDT